MRTTLTIDNDISAVLTKLQRDLHVPFKKLINDTLREGLERVTSREKVTPKKKYATPSVSVGEVFIANLDNISEVLGAAEGDLYR